MKKKLIAILLSMGLIFSNNPFFVNVQASNMNSYIESSNIDLRSEVLSSIEELKQCIIDSQQYSPNPYDYIVENSGYNRLVDLGYKALPIIQDIVETSNNDGLITYILNIAIEEISKVNTKVDYKNWETGKEGTKVFKNLLIEMPTKVKEITSSNESIDKKNNDLVKLGIFATPYILDNVNKGHKEVEKSLNKLLEEKEVDLSKATKNGTYVHSNKETDKARLKEDRINEIKALIPQLISSAKVKENYTISNTYTLTGNNPTAFMEDDRNDIGDSVGTSGSLYYSRSFYDKISWTWTKIGSYNGRYNCLAYALGYQDRWLWPWTKRPATHKEVNDLLIEKRYETASTVTNLTGIPLRIIAYGDDDIIIHFARVTGSNTCNSKWGPYELMKHNSHSPYYMIEREGFGLPKMWFYKK